MDALIHKIAEITHLGMDSFLLCDIYNHKINAIYTVSRTECLRRYGINSRTELVVYEIPGTMEVMERELEKMGKRPEECESGDRVDVQVEEGVWVPAQVTNVKSTSQSKELLVTYFHQELRSHWISNHHPTLSPFRVHSRKDTDRLLRFQVIHRKPGPDPASLVPFGVPMMVAVSSWMTYQDLIQITVAKLGNFMRTQSKKPSLAQQYKDELVRIDSNRRPFSLKILSPAGNFCHNCGVKCTGCEFPALKSTLENITAQNAFIISADWTQNTYISQEFEDDESLAAAKALDERNLSSLNVLECMNEFTKEEEIDGVCERCKEKKMSMKMDVWRLPDILIVNLKRFAYVSGTFEKLDQQVTYPLTAFDMSQYVRLEVPTGLTQSTTALQRAYDLYAVVFHAGSMESGHYTTCCMHEHEGRTRWLLYDDEQVFEVTGDVIRTVVSRNAYLLFYRRRKMASSNLVNLACLS